MPTSWAQIPDLSQSKFFTLPTIGFLIFFEWDNIQVQVLLGRLKRGKSPGEYLVLCKHSVILAAIQVSDCVLTISLNDIQSFYLKYMLPQLSGSFGETFAQCYLLECSFKQSQVLLSCVILPPHSFLIITELLLKEYSQKVAGGKSRRALSPAPLHALFSRLILQASQLLHHPSESSSLFSFPSPVVFLNSPEFFCRLSYLWQKSLNSIFLVMAKALRSINMLFRRFC